MIYEEDPLFTGQKPHVEATVISSGDPRNVAVNVMPSKVEALLDMRLFPNQKPIQVVSEMNQLLDSFTPDQDAVAVILDTLNDKRTAFGFIVTAAGVRTDIAIFEDAEMGDTPWNTDWNAFWDASTHLDSGGWSAEIRIPFSSLRFKSRDGQAEMGMILWRYIAQNVEYDIFPAIPNNWNLSAYKPSQAQSTEIEGIALKSISAACIATRSVLIKFNYTFIMS